MRLALLACRLAIFELDGGRTCRLADDLTPERDDGARRWRQRTGVPRAAELRTMSARGCTFIASYAVWAGGMWEIHAPHCVAMHLYSRPLRHILIQHVRFFAHRHPRTRHEQLYDMSSYWAGYKLVCPWAGFSYLTKRKSLCALKSTHGSWLCFPCRRLCCLRLRPCPRPRPCRPWPRQFCPPAFAFWSPLSLFCPTVVTVRRACCYYASGTPLEASWLL